MAIHSRLADTPFEPESELAGFIAELDGEGAVVSFVGLARPATKTGEAVHGLFLDHHPRLTVLSLEAIAAESERRFQVSAVRIVHRCGAIRPGEPIVFVAAASRHRRAAFEAADYLMDRLKTEAMFWKREDGPDGSRWIEPTDRDYADRDRWR
ncbi:molybdenum cofactor biosynthesis protein MoaE [Sphingosinicella terrae]|jgi:molybdopterin synthase catalytic subunit|uniref:molybdenum cofactor biosynthesis protein MoaE n=1 Tax=Sphingosinicella terrae TaxID=2172047 RepID=UPI000E0D0BA4|nr:molybdenum cofactor biosynthesis protein MoaE [Sphingosinicella terrae]